MELISLKKLFWMFSACCLAFVIMSFVIQDKEPNIKDNERKPSGLRDPLAPAGIIEEAKLSENERGYLNLEKRSPNVILMLIDDLGYGDLGYSGHPTSRTPAIDRLARGGTIFTQFYVTSPVCSPSRASLLTGRYQVRSGVWPGVFTPRSLYGMPHSETTIAEILKKQGYNTMMTGKWHLGVGKNREYLPFSQGFDDYLGVPYSHDMCGCPVCFPGDLPCIEVCWENLVSCPLFRNTTIIQQPTILTCLTQTLVDRANLFLRESVAQYKPFFLYFPFMHVHSPQFSSAKHYNTSIRGRFGDTLAELDDAIDQIVKQVDDLGVTEDTLIWFLSDNGPSLMRHAGGGSAGVLRCGKGTTYEGGVRVPAFVSWPGTVPSATSDALVSALDVLPTIASLTQATVAELTLDGFDVTDTLLKRGSGDESPREFFAIYPYKPAKEIGPYAVIWRNYKAHFFTLGSGISDNSNYDHNCTSKHTLTLHSPPLLFDLSVDPGERWSLSKDPQYHNVIATMTSWRSSHMASMTWMEPLMNEVDDRSQPCCGDSTCEPFPQCCDCHG